MLFELLSIDHALTLSCCVSNFFCPAHLERSKGLEDSIIKKFSWKDSCLKFVAGLGLLRIGCTVYISVAASSSKCVTLGIEFNSSDSKAASVMTWPRDIFFRDVALIGCCGEYRRVPSSSLRLVNVEYLQEDEDNNRYALESIYNSLALPLLAFDQKNHR